VTRLDRLLRDVQAEIQTIDGKVDQLERKADAAGQVLDGLVTTAGQQGQKIDRLEAKSDRALFWLEVNHGQLDMLLGNVGQLEGKADALEGKADRLEVKADETQLLVAQLGGKVDRLEGKTDRQELKLDRSERKADQLERKHDRLESKLDNPIPLQPHEASIADQRGGATNVTSAVAAIGPSGAVFLSAAVDRPRAALPNPASWSPWISFGRPGGLRPLSVSIDLQYQQGSNNRIDAVLFARVAGGVISQRVFLGPNHDSLLTPSAWSPWRALTGPP
jgi:hypothetical protein